MYNVKEKMHQTIELMVITRIMPMNYMWQTFYCDMHSNICDHNSYNNALSL